MLKHISILSIFLLAAMFAITTFAKGKPQYYETRVYSFKTAAQKTVVEDYFKNAAIARHKTHSGYVRIESSQNFLRQPGSAQKPPALRTIFNFEMMLIWN